MLPPLPTSTLFPYTTLFRSDLEPEVAGVARGAAIVVVRQLARLGQRGTLLGDPKAGRQLRDARPIIRRVEEVAVAVPLAIEDEDRKTTRLNSSHANSSYAVC